MPHVRLRDAAEILGVSTDTVRRLADRGELRATRTRGGRRRIDGVSLARHLARSGADDEGASRQSIRNRLPGIVVRVVRDKVAAQVEIQVGRHRLVALVTREAADALRLEPGMPAVASVKATNLSVEVPGAPTRRRRAE